MISSQKYSSKHNGLFSYAELLRIKPEIEGTKSNTGLTVREREFSWIYEPEKPLVVLEDYSSYDSDGKNHTVTFKMPRNTLAKATVHNHCNGKTTPSDYDIKDFLKFMELNPEMVYSLIASIDESAVAGYFVMKYTGNRDEINKMKQIAFGEIVRLTSKEIERNPDMYKAMHVGSDDLSVFDCLQEIPLVILPLIQIASEFVPMPGYVVDNHKFKKA